MSWFNRKQKTVLGIDISAAAVKLLELSKTGARYKVESFAVVPLHQDGLVDKNIANVTITAEAIKTALIQSGSKVSEAMVAVSGSAVMTKIITMPTSLTENEMEEQIMIEADQYVPYSLEEINFDFEVQGINENNPELVNVLLVASRKENVDDRVEALLKAGLKTSIVDVESFAMENAFALLSAHFASSVDAQTVAIADIGSAMATLTVLHDGNLVYTHEQGFGGKQLTEEIQRRYGLSYAEAGLAKKQGGLPDNYIVDVLNPFKKSMVQHIQRSLQFYVSSSANRSVDSIVLAGGCALIAGIDKLVENNLGVPVYIANPFINMTLSNKIKPDFLSNNAPSMMIACGLALRGFD
ncbi:pilus assembly protein PilM [Methylobacter sp. S3L5C]|uniref:pilus assembly protein PilM n=1 Tax=Methylobacter sp. S3L5C TaxID=2839024 RepID=UPI001FAE5349|nr:pilus assembly protein PilM [Methylobacter sp. S3L5C]UOA07542.1 pilus assembly protein PilM [Methylobacter sp. S3L5C]